MDSTPIIVTQIVDAPIENAWDAITDKKKMKDWYFDLPDFKPEVGTGFSFYGGHDEKKYLHVCRVTEVIPGKKISYSWRYDGYGGDSLVTFELLATGEKTSVQLTHSGIETFPAENPDLAKENFVEGWNQIIGTSLKDYLER